MSTCNDEERILKVVQWCKMFNAKGNERISLDFVNHKSFEKPPKYSFIFFILLHFFSICT